MSRCMSVIGVVCFVGAWMVGMGTGPAWANPTGAGLLSYPVEPCRVLDTRVSLGPLGPGNAMDVYVRGSALQAGDGAAQADCGIPPEAEAVVLDIAAITPTGPGNLKVNGTGWVGGVNGVYSRINYRLGENDANEIQVSLCNVFLYPAAQVPCPANEGRYADLQILNVSSLASLHVVADVVGYLARPPQNSKLYAISPVVNLLTAQLNHHEHVVVILEGVGQDIVLPAHTRVSDLGTLTIIHRGTGVATITVADGGYIGDVTAVSVAAGESVRLLVSGGLNERWVQW